MVLFVYVPEGMPLPLLSGNVPFGQAMSLPPDAPYAALPFTGVYVTGAASVLMPAKADWSATEYGRKSRSPLPVLSS